MASQGPNSPGTLANDASVGVEAWSFPSFAGNSDNSYANQALLSLTYSNYLKSTNFGFSIPSGATIDGIIVEIEKRDSIYLSQDSTVKLVKGGTIVGTNKSLLGSWTNVDSYYTYGSSSDLWGTTWTDSDINASDFGVVINAYNPSFKSNAYLYIDHVRITVHYTSGGGGGSSTNALLYIGN